MAYATDGWQWSAGWLVASERHDDRRPVDGASDADDWRRDVVVPALEPAPARPMRAQDEIGHDHRSQRVDPASDESVTLATGTRAQCRSTRINCGPSRLVRVWDCFIRPRNLVRAPRITTVNEKLVDVWTRPPAAGMTSIDVISSDCRNAVDHVSCATGHTTEGISADLEAQTRDYAMLDGRRRALTVSRPTRTGPCSPAGTRSSA